VFKKMFWPTLIIRIARSVTTGQPRFHLFVPVRHTGRSFGPACPTHTHIWFVCSSRQLQQPGPASVRTGTAAEGFWRAGCCVQAHRILAGRVMEQQLAAVLRALHTSSASNFVLCVTPSNKYRYSLFRLELLAPIPSTLPLPLDYPWPSLAPGDVLPLHKRGEMCSYSHIHSRVPQCRGSMLDEDHA
jgi:hypothetical protein